MIPRVSDIEYAFVSPHGYSRWRINDDVVKALALIQLSFTREDYSPRDTKSFLGGGKLAAIEKQGCRCLRFGRKHLYSETTAVRVSYKVHFETKKAKIR